MSNPTDLIQRSAIKEIAVRYANQVVEEADAGRFDAPRTEMLARALLLDQAQLESQQARIRTLEEALREIRLRSAGKIEEIADKALSQE